MKVRPRPFLAALPVVIVSLLTGVEAVAQVGASLSPTSAPNKPAFYGNWGPWFLRLKKYYRSFPSTRPFLLKDPKDAYKLGKGWSVQIYNHGLWEHPTVGRSGRLPGSLSSYEVCASWAIWKWSKPEIDRNEQVLLHATANWVDSKDVEITRENTSYVDYEFTFAGGPNDVGTAELEAWWQMIAYAKADAPASQTTAECGVQTAIAGSYLDGIGANMDWNGGAKSESKSGLFPLTLRLTILGLGVSVKMTTAADGTTAVTKSKGHRPKASKRVRGTAQMPAVITVQKIAATSTGARVVADAAIAGPGSSILDFHCWFRGKFGVVAKAPAGRREGN